MKHETRKPGTRKGFAALVALVLILCVTIGGTIAWITAQTGEVVNTFTPATVNTYIDENVDGGKKSNITVMNPSDPDTETNIPVYIRVAVVVNWVDDKDATKIAPGPDFALPTTLGQNWVLNTTDGYYYYKVPVPVGESTNELFTTAIEEPDDKPDGIRLQVTILAEAIQADGVDSDGKKAVEAAWGVDPTKLS